MSDPERNPPILETSPEEEREHLLAEALAHANAQEEAFRRPMLEAERTGRWKTPLSILIFLFAGYVAVSPPSWVVPAAAPILDRGTLERGARAALYLQAREIEAYRVLRGRLPVSLDELPARVSGVRFIRSDNRVFQLVGRRPDGSSLVYDSAHPAPDFASVAAGWSGRREP